MTSLKPATSTDQSNAGLGWGHQSARTELLLVSKDDGEFSIVKVKLTDLGNTKDILRISEPKTTSDQRVQARKREIAGATKPLRRAEMTG